MRCASRGVPPAVDAAAAAAVGAAADAAGSPSGTASPLRFRSLFCRRVMVR